jgi:asparagine synthetase B (glutamine-hydrolysing)
VWHMEEPVCEPPAVALYYISRLAQQHVKVLLSGEGGDEAFPGYENYLNTLRLKRVNAALGSFAGPLGAAAAIAGRLFDEEFSDMASHLDFPFRRTTSAALRGPHSISIGKQRIFSQRSS